MDEGRPRRTGGPWLPVDARPEELDKEVLDELSGMPDGLAERVARHLVVAGRALDDDPESAYEHASFARELAPRIAVVREAAGLAAYRCGHFAEALSDLRTVRRITGNADLLAILADIERGMGRPERALELAGSSDAAKLDREQRLELRIVAAGARRDLGQLDAALVTLQIPELERGQPSPPIARLRYAYADTLLAAGRHDEAVQWFIRAAEADPTEETDASVMVADLTGVEVVSDSVEQPREA